MKFSTPSSSKIIKDLSHQKQAFISSCSGADGTSGYNTAINSILAAMKIYGMVATA